MQPTELVSNERIIVLQAQLGQWDNLNHLLVCAETRQAAIIDPFDGEFWHQVCAEHGWDLREVWLTHSHWDHTKGVKGTKDLLGTAVKVECVKRDRVWFANHSKELVNASKKLPMPLL